MLSLLRKDFDWLSIATLTGVVTLSVVLINYGFVRTWITHDGNLNVALLLTWSILALLAGLFAALRDEVFGTRDYLLHRPISRKKVFWVKSFWALIMMIIWFALPFVIITIWPMKFSENRSIADYGRLLNYASMATVMLPSFALGYFTGTARGNIFLRFLQGTIVLVPLLIFVFFSILGLSRTSLPYFATWQIIFAALLAWIASLNERNARDADRPQPTKIAILNIALLTICLTITGSFGFSTLGSSAQWSLRSASPQVARLSDGSFSLSKWMPSNTLDGYQNLHAVDANHVVQPRIINSKARYYADDGAMRHLKQTFTPTPDQYFFVSIAPELGIGDRWIELPSTNQEAYVNDDEGQVFEYLVSNFMSQGTSPSILSSKKQGGERFKLARPHYPNLGSAYALLLVDYADSTPWIKRRRKPGDFVKLVLPDGGYSWNLLEPGSGYGYGDEVIRRSDKNGLDLILVMGGDHEIYQLKGNTFVPFPPDPSIITRSEQVNHREPTIDKIGPWREELTHWDPLTPEITAKGSRPDVATTFRFAPRTTEEKLYAGLLILTTTLKPGWNNIAGFFHDDAPEFRSDSLTRSALFLNGRYPWILLANLAFTVLIAWHQRRRLLRIKASLWTANSWAMAILIAGPLTAVLVFFLERPRAFAAVHVVPVENIPPCLLKSA